jgi:endonuclease YncB( thermonuclease family)
MPFRETLLNLAITAVLVLIITLVAILLKESRPVPVAAIPIGKAAAPATSPSENGLPPPKAEFEVFPKAKLVESKNNEADTLRIKLDDRHDEIVFTLYFVDAPDASLTHPQLVQDQSRYFQINQDNVLKMGAEAAAYVTGLLKTKPFTLLTRWEPVPDRSRYYALILVETEKGNVYLADLLMQKGYGRLAGISCDLPGGVKGADDYGLYLHQLSKQAREAKIGVWGAK